MKLSIKNSFLNLINRLYSNNQNDMSNKKMIHTILKSDIKAPLNENEEEILFGCGCFWGAEKGFWRLPGVISTAVGYAGGTTENPSYREVCSGTSGHTEVVRVVWNKDKIDLSDLLKLFWECHDPTQGNRQGNDSGTQYRSAIYTTKESQYIKAESSKISYQQELLKNGFRNITTEIKDKVKFFYGEEYHQQYLAKPGSRPYCSAMPTKVKLTNFVGSNFKLDQEIWKNYNWDINHCILRGENTPIT